MKLVIGNGSVEVVQINTAARSVSMLITIPCKAEEIASEDAKVMVLHKANFAFWYLQQEGFIPDNKSGWLFHLGAIAKPKLA
jgi:hypothetical protein